MNALALLALTVFTADGVVDRIEGDLAVVEWTWERGHGQWFTDIPVARLPPGTREGDRLVIYVGFAPVSSPQAGASNHKTPEQEPLHEQRID